MSFHNPMTTGTQKGYCLLCFCPVCFPFQARQLPRVGKAAKQREGEVRNVTACEEQVLASAGQTEPVQVLSVPAT